MWYLSFLTGLFHLAYLQSPASFFSRSPGSFPPGWLPAVGNLSFTVLAVCLRFHQGKERKQGNGVILPQQALASDKTFQSVLDNKMPKCRNALPPGFQLQRTRPSPATNTRIWSWEHSNLKLKVWLSKRIPGWIVLSCSHLQLYRFYLPRNTASSVHDILPALRGLQAALSQRGPREGMTRWEQLNEVDDYKTDSGGEARRKEWKETFNMSEWNFQVLGRKLVNL